MSSKLYPNLNFSRSNAVPPIYMEMFKIFRDGYYLSSQQCRYHLGPKYCKWEILVSLSWWSGWNYPCWTGQVAQSNHQNVHSKAFIFLSDYLMLIVTTFFTKTSFPHSWTLSMLCVIYVAPSIFTILEFMDMTYPDFLHIQN